MVVIGFQQIHFTTHNLLKLLEEVACGMEYVASKKYLHRNLLCSNVFLNSKKQCKIGNFENAVYVGDSDGVYVEKVISLGIEYNVRQIKPCIDALSSPNLFVSGSGRR